MIFGIKEKFWPIQCIIGYCYKYTRATYDWVQGHILMKVYNIPSDVIVQVWRVFTWPRCTSITVSCGCWWRAVWISTSRWAAAADLLCDVKAFSLVTKRLPGFSSGGDEREDCVTCGGGAARPVSGEPAAQQRGQCRRRHVQRLHRAASGCGPAGRRHRQPPVPGWSRQDDQKHGGRDGPGSSRRQRWCKETQITLLSNKKASSLTKSSESDRRLCLFQSQPTLYQCCC